MDRYDAQTIETKWQRIWEESRAFEVPNPEPGAPRNERKSYVLEMLPYPSGSLHIGHVLVYTLGDVLAHFYRRTGSEVLRPMGYDSFGLPAENAAIKEGEHPREIVERNIAAIRRTMKRLGWAIDWSREFSTHEPEYYRWTQWLFLKFFEAGQAYRKAAIVNWCPNDQTVLANEQVKNGRCERCGCEVEARKLEQWFFRITAYADHLLDEMKELQWPERVLAMQRNWIGRSEGAEILFRVEELDLDIPGLTTPPDTLFGSAQFSGLPHEEAATANVEWLGTRGRGRPAVSYRLRDWGWSRQRYWGCPIPVVYCGDCGIVPVPEEELPVLLPEVEDYTPKGVPPLAQAEDWVRVPCPRCGQEGRREGEPMDTFADSTRYFLRYCDP